MILGLVNIWIFLAFLIVLALLPQRLDGSGCMPMLLLSPGRSATDTICGTLVKNSKNGFKYCHEKETFKKKIPTEALLRDCVRGAEKHGNASSYVHVKPEHISMGLKSTHQKPKRAKQSKRAEKPPSRGRLSSSGSWSSGKKLTTPEEFFLAAKAAGYRLVVISFRENQLAREVSSFERATANKPAAEAEVQAKIRFIDRDLRAFFRHLVEGYNRAVKAAKSANFEGGLLAISFDEIVSDVCRTARRIAERACTGQATTMSCQEHLGHTDKSHHDRTLVGRVGPVAAKSIITQLTSSEYEWMLDLERRTWPPGAAANASHLPLVG
jgi:hypothetical protein